MSITLQGRICILCRRRIRASTNPAYTQVKKKLCRLSMYVRALLESEATLMLLRCWSCKDARPISSGPSSSPRGAGISVDLNAEQSGKYRDPVMSDLSIINKSRG